MIVSWIVLSIFSAAPELPEAGAAFASHQNFALVLGLNRSLDEDRAPLRYADDDAMQYATLLRELGIKTWLLTEPDDDTARLYGDLQIDGAPSHAGMLAALGVINGEIARHQNTGGTAAFYFVYAGHGDVRNGEGYVTLADGPLTRTDFYVNVIGRSLADINHVVIDACKAYYLVFGRGEAEPPERVAYAKPFGEDMWFRRENTGFLLSTSSAGESHEWEAFQSGVFSHEVRSALRGAADLNADGKLSYNEVAAFVYAANKAIPNAKYRPDFLAIPPVHDDTFANLNNEESATLILDAAEPHHYLIESGDGHRLADVRPGVTGLTIRIGGGQSYLLNLDTNREYELNGSGETVRLSTLEGNAPRVGARGAAQKAFTHLFAHPFDESAIADAVAAGHVAMRKPLHEPTALSLADGDNAGGGPFRSVRLGVAGGILFGIAGTAAYFEGNQLFGSYKKAPMDEQAPLRRQTKKMDAYARVGWSLAVVSIAGGFLFDYFWPEDSSAKEATP